MVLPNIPQEIIADILTRLPVKSLLRFRCVSKPWLSLIENPQFIKSHLNFSIHNNNHSMSCVFDSPLAIYSCLLDSAIQQSPVKATLLDSTLNGIEARVGLLGSCNGLICISIPRSTACVVLLNPSTKKWTILPNLDPPPMTDVIHGFGYDELNDDYKIVQIFSTLSLVDFSMGENAVNVYSLRTNSWRSIEVSGLFLLNRAGKFADGALHWLVRQVDGLNSLGSISSFDLGNETFQNIDLPNSTDTGGNLVLGVLGGSLCLCRDYYQQRLDLWILENGVKNPWTKLVSIPYTIDPEGPILPMLENGEIILLFESHISPLFVSENGEILLLFGSQFILYNQKDKTFYYPNIHMGRTSRSSDEIEACIYVESLVSPNTGGEGKGNQ